MLKIFAIDFVRQALEQTMFEEHLKDINLYGGKDQVSILSFYEQLKNQDEVDRFVETYRDLSDQQNRTGLILNGVLVSPENPTITNLYSCLIVPLTWSLSFRCNIANRDSAIVSINNLTTQLKGKKVDIAQLVCEDYKGGKCYKPFKVGTIGQNQGQPALKNGDYIGHVATLNVSNVYNLLSSFENKGIQLGSFENKYQYISTNVNDKPVLKAIHIYLGNEDIIEGRISFDEITTTQPNIINVSIYDQDVSYKKEEISLIRMKFVLSSANHTYTTDWVEGTVTSASNGTINSRFALNSAFTYYLEGEQLTSVSISNFECRVRKINVRECEETETNIDIPPEHTSFEKYKLSMSFDAIRCDEPRNLNGNEYCELTFSGSATLVNESVALGNDLLKVAISKIGVDAQTSVAFTNAPTYYLEPMEMPSGNNANTKLNQLVSNHFKNNSHTDAISLTLQYSFICDMSIDIIKQWYNYARYGQVSIALEGICPNLKYSTKEIVCSWGNYEQHEVITKIVESIDIENSESDVLTIGLTMQIQGENN